jgi:hypothetical protein
MDNSCKINKASPGFPGIIKFKCSIWPSCPMFDRSRTDETYLLSPETLLYAPQSLRDRILSIRGVDGVYLKPRPNFYLHNFLAFRKRNVASVVADDSVTSDFGSPRKKNKKSNIVKLKDLEFLGLLRELTANELVLEGSSAITSSAYASHQTWIADGSLFCSDNYLPSDAFNSTEEGSDPQSYVRCLKKQLKGKAFERSITG